MLATVRNRGGQSGKNTNSRLLLSVHRLRAQSCALEMKSSGLCRSGGVVTEVLRRDDGARQV